MPRFYDTHAHLDFPDFNDDINQVIDRAIEAGITKIITIGTDLDSSARAVQLAERFPPVYAAVGWHPGYVKDAPPDVRPSLRPFLDHPKVVAVGETGLDYHHLPEDNSPETLREFKQRQAEVFQHQLELASEIGLNCVIHQRDAFHDTLAQLKPFANRVRGVFHCFVNDPAEVEQILELNSIVSFTGIITFKNAESVRNAMAATPLDKFMLETDCPFLAPVPFRGKRCEPSHVPHIAQVAARVKGCSLEELSTATCATAEIFFPKLK